MADKITLSEEQDGEIWKKWMEKAKSMKYEDYPEFFRHLSEDYHHDYGTVCHAIAAATVAAFYAFDRSKSGGITGFQANCIMWEIISGIGVFGEGPLRMQNMRDLLYPQGEKKFRSISSNMWSGIQEQAKTELANSSDAHPNVIAHWKSIVEGEVPFGLTVCDN